MINCIIIDDEPLARTLLSEFIGKTPGLSLIGAYSSALQATPILHRQKPEVIFLDIQMPDLTGIDFLQSLEHRPAIIMTTAYSEYALSGFELDVVDYLLKPFDFNRFLRAVNKLRERITKPRTDASTAEVQKFIFVKDGTKLIRIDLDTIHYIKGSREYVTIITNDRKILSLQSMKKLEEELPASFTRIHNSYIVRLASIQVVHKEEVEVNGERLPIGLTYKKQFLSRIQFFTK